MGWGLKRVLTDSIKLNLKRVVFFLDKEFVVEFDFLGKDSIRYHNFVQVEKRVFKNLGLFMDNKKEGDDLFDRLNTSILNEYLSSLSPGLTAKVFRTYNASITLQEQLKLLTDPDDNIPSKVRPLFSSRCRCSALRQKWKYLWCAKRAIAYRKI